MCFFSSSKPHPLESGGGESQWQYVRKRVGGKVVSRQIMRGDQVVRLEGRWPRAVLVTPDTKADSEEVVVNHTETVKRGGKDKREKKEVNPKTKAGEWTTEKKTVTTGVPAWDSWEQENDDKETSEQDCNKASEDWVVHDLYIEKDDAQENKKNEKASKLCQGQNTNAKKGGRKGGNQNDKRVASDTKVEKNQGNDTTTDWKPAEYEGDWCNSNENSWGPADADRQLQEGWESGRSATNNDDKPNNTDDWGGCSQSPGENNNSEESDDTQKVPGAWPDGGTENESDKNSVKAKKAQAVNKKNKTQRNSKGSKKPRVKGKGGNATVEFCVCEVDNSVSFKSAQEILDNCQPGEWQQDEHGNPFFQRAEEEENTDDAQTGFADIQTDTVDGQW